MGLVRVFLALAVVATHNQFQSPFLHASFAVNLFFAISGFCMALVLNQKYTERNPARFYIARYLRLWPTYFVVLMLVAIFIQPLPSVGLLGGLSTYFYVSTFTLFGNETLWWFTTSNGKIDFLDPDPHGPTLAALTGMQQMWSVGIELGFYLLSPLFARNWRVVLALFVATFLIHVWMEMTVSVPLPLGRSSMNFFWIYLAGMLSYWLWTGCRDRLDALSISPLIASCAGVLIAAGCTAMRSHGDLAILLFAASLCPLFQFTKSFNIDRTLGELSYPIYVVHWPIVRYLITDHRVTAQGTLLIIALTLLAATALHLLIERPVEKWRTRPSLLSKPHRIFVSKLMSQDEAARVESELIMHARTRRARHDPHQLD